MKPDHSKPALIGAWIMGMAVLAVTIDPNSLGAWTMLIAVGLLPTLVVLKLWNPPAPTLSERIRQATAK